MDDDIKKDIYKIMQEFIECGLTEEDIQSMATEAGVLMMLIKRDETIRRVLSSVSNDKPGIIAVTDKRIIFIVKYFDGAMSYSEVRHEDIVFVKHELHEKTGDLIIKTVKKSYAFEQLKPFDVFDIYLLIHELITNISEERVATPNPI